MSNHQEIVNQFQQVPGVSGLFVVNAGGQVETSTVSESLDPEIGAIVSSMFSNIGVQIKRMQRGSVKRLILETEKGITLLATLTGGGILVVFADVTTDFNLSKLLDVKV